MKVTIVLLILSFVFYGISVNKTTNYNETRTNIASKPVIENSTNYNKTSENKVNVNQQVSEHLLESKLEESKIIKTNDDSKSAVSSYKVDDNFEKMTINTDTANVRSGPGFIYNIVKVLNKHDIVFVYNRKEADGRTWLNIGDSEWVSINTTNKSDNTLILTSESVIQYYYVITESANIRSGPGFKHNVLGQLTQGDIFRVVEHKDSDGRTWLSLDSGVWVSSNTALRIVENADYIDSLVGNSHLITSSIANVRTGPGFDNPIIKILEKGDSVFIFDLRYNYDRIWCETNDGWISVNTINGSIE